MTESTQQGLKFKLDISPLADALAKLSKVGSKAGIDAAYEEAEKIMTEAKLRTPVDTGALRSSGLVSVDRRTTARFDVLMTFGGAASAYAVPVHENLHASHPVGQAKFLESAMRDWQAHGGIDALGRKIGAALEAVGR